VSTALAIATEPLTPLAVEAQAIKWKIITVGENDNAFSYCVGANCTNPSEVLLIDVGSRSAKYEIIDRTQSPPQHIKPDGHKVTCHLGGGEKGALPEKALAAYYNDFLLKCKNALTEHQPAAIVLGFTAAIREALMSDDPAISEPAQKLVQETLATLGLPSGLNPVVSEVAEYYFAAHAMLQAGLNHTYGMTIGGRTLEAVRTKDGAIAPEECGTIRIGSENLAKLSADDRAKAIEEALAQLSWEKGFAPPNINLFATTFSNTARVLTALAHTGRNLGGKANYEYVCDQALTQILTDLQTQSPDDLFKRAFGASQAEIVKRISERKKKKAIPVLVYGGKEYKETAKDFDLLLAKWERDTRGLAITAAVMTKVIEAYRPSHISIRDINMQQGMLARVGLNKCMYA